MTRLGYRQEMMRRLRRANGIDRDSDVAIGAVFEADWTREAGVKFTVYLALGRARADGAPRHEIGEVLRRNHVEKFGAGRHAALVKLQHQVTRNLQPFIYMEAPVESGVVDQS